MAKADKTDDQQVNPAVEPLTLNEFCLRLSTRDKRVELIGAFNFVEKQAGRFKDAESNYQARFEAFVNKPV
ncbi:hypothetical protein [Bordetella phage vB_BbrM_PHB04]|uniref:Uncharacterized protein n=1 Tax=Bordetella phage vB_BbrM_PHB04 TaxID=2029657 RepID=A0A291L9W1_9CAUD|nr:hypothetical protein HOS14_gp013 [Bordetella phage vB_BbrM_PHB04]ATI15631.1 hypothetical protein [Bordetella phage vB_BbrM_PHB04]